MPREKMGILPSRRQALGAIAGATSLLATPAIVRAQSPLAVRFVQQRGLRTLLIHELTHVTTLAGKRDGANRGAWWLVEGIADYATMIDKSVRSYDAISQVRAFVRGSWNSDPAVDPPTTTSSLEDASARYGVAFLAVRCLAERHGEDKMLAFFGRVVHDNQTLEVASTAELGLAWATVRADCRDYIRKAVS